MGRLICLGEDCSKAALRSQAMHALVGYELSAAGENGIPGRKVEDAGSQPLNLHLGIALEEPLHPQRLLPGHEPMSGSPYPYATPEMAFFHRPAGNGLHDLPCVRT